MKKFFSICLYLLLLSITIFLASCSDDNSENNSNKEGDNYYVKYTATMNSGRYTTKRTIVFRTENGEETISTMEKEWEATFGPVPKNFVPYLRVSLDNNTYFGPGTLGSAYVSGYIHISKNKEPFVVKVYKEMNLGPIELSCNIDF